MIVSWKEVRWMQIDDTLAALLGIEPKVHGALDGRETISQILVFCGFLLGTSKRIQYVY
jgi:hypothetical protein